MLTKAVGRLCTERDLMHVYTRTTCYLYVDNITIHLCHDRLVSLCIATGKQQTGNNFVDGNKQHVDGNMLPGNMLPCKRGLRRSEFQTQVGTCESEIFVRIPSRIESAATIRIRIEYLSFAGPYM